MPVTAYLKERGANRGTRWPRHCSRWASMMVCSGCVKVARAGIAANRGKTRVFNFAGGPAPPRVAELGPDVWSSDKLVAEHGFVALGTPIGTAEYMQAWGMDRLAMEEALLRQLPQMPDLQCAGLLLCYRAAPRANHALRTIPPTLSGVYAAAHDAAAWGTLQACSGEPAEDAACPARDIALLPACLGGLGLAQAVRAAPAAYWAAWADALPVLAARSPAFAAWTVRALSGELEHAGGRRQVIARGRRLERAPRLGRARARERRASRIRNLFFRDHVLCRHIGAGRKIRQIPHLAASQVPDAAGTCAKALRARRPA